MTDIVYPASIPAARDGEFSEDFLETKVEDAGEVGAPRRRNRFTRGLNRFSFKIVATAAQKAWLHEFYEITLERGVRSFLWTHTRTGQVYEVVMPSRPKAAEISGDIWRIEIEMAEI